MLFFRRDSGNDLGLPGAQPSRLGMGVSNETSTDTADNRDVDFILSALASLRKKLEKPPKRHN